jgi:N-acetylglucosamine-6-sulfatase
MRQRVALLLGAFLTLSSFGVLTLPTTPASALEPAPNIVVIMTDDQGIGFLDAMPAVESLIRDHGVQFDNAFVPTSLCCPSRASLLSGLYSHTTGVYYTFGDHGGWSNFQQWEDQTIAVALNDAGYRTALIGKYINGWAGAAKRGTAEVPAGWDYFSAMGADSGGDGAYYDYSLLGTEVSQRFGAGAEDYSTDVLGANAIEFIESTPADQPIFLYLAPYGPHFPHTPAPRDVGLWHEDPLNPAVLEEDLRDKPRWVRRNEQEPKSKIVREIRGQHEALMSVDDQVAAVVDSLGASRLADTLFIFTSDNGLMNGEHGLNGKYTGYAGATEVPLIMRWDGHLEAGASSNRVMTPEDITETIADAAGVQMDTEGVGIFDGGRAGTVLEAIADNKHPAYCGYRSRRYVFIEYDGRARELYDYRRDPYELVNRVAREKYRDERKQLRSRAKEACYPLPPGFSW